MSLLPRSVAALLVYLAIFYNLDRFGIGPSLIHLHPFVYGFVTVVVALIILVSTLRRQSFPVLLVASTVLYILIKLIFFSGDILRDVTIIYVTLAELTLLAIAVLLAYDTAWKLEDFIRAIENITFAGLRKVVNIREAVEGVEGELYRSRRYKHSMTVVMVEPQMETLNVAIHSTVKDVQASMMERYALVSLMTQALNNQLRRSDSLLDLVEKKKFVILLPETQNERSSVIIRRIAEAANEMGVKVSCGTATFPTDGLTFEGLLQEAESHATTCKCEPDQLPSSSIVQPVASEQLYENRDE